MDKQNAIEVRNVNKDFKIEYDKANTLKERLLFFGRSNVEYHHVLKDININIKNFFNNFILFSNNNFL